MIDTLSSSPVTLAAGYLLVGPAQPLLMLIPLCAWAWLVSSVFDKHAARFFLGRETWNLVHLSAGLAAVAAVVFMPVGGWAGFAAGFVALLAILGLDVGLFVGLTNRDDRVPESSRLTLDFSKWKEAREEKAAAKRAGTSTMQVKGPTKALVPVPDKGTPEFDVRVAAEEVVIRAITARASQLDLAPAGEGQYAASSLVDGVRQAGEPILAAQAVAVMDFWKKAAGLDVSDRRRRQTGTVTCSTGAGTTEIRVTGSGGQSGMKLTLLFDPAKAVRRTPEQLGLLPAQMEAVRAMVSDAGGVVLLAAPSDSGRTTTLYTLLRMHDAYTSNVQTIEMEIDDALEGIRQNLFDATKEGADFATQLRSMLRRDPDVVGVAEVPDVQTAQEIAKADLARTRVYASFRVDGAMTAIQTWTKAVGDAKKAGAALHGAISQRLVRKLCENCRVAYPPPPEMLKTLGLPADKVQQLHKKGGQVLIRNKPETCPVCQGIGYVGQVGVFEVYPLGEPERALIAREDWAGLRTELRKKQTPSIAQAALRRAVEGLTSVEEVTRVTSATKPKPAASQAAKA